MFLCILTWKHQWSIKPHRNFYQKIKIKINKYYYYFYLFDEEINRSIKPGTIIKIKGFLELPRESELEGCFNYKEYLPFPMAYNEDELYNILKDIDKYTDKHKEDIEKFYNIYHKNSDGHVCERVINMIRNKEFKSEKEIENEN